MSCVKRIHLVPKPIIIIYSHIPKIPKTPLTEISLVVAGLQWSYDSGHLHALGKRRYCTNSIILDKNPRLETTGPASPVARSELNMPTAVLRATKVRY